MHAVNLDAGFHIARELARRLIATREPGSFLMLTSLHADTPFNLPHYSTAKAALAMLVKELARTLGRFGIQVNALVPGAIASGDVVAEPSLAQHIPLGRLGRSEDLVPIALAVLSNRVSAYVTGAAFVVDGGLSLTNWIDPPALDLWRDFADKDGYWRQAPARLHIGQSLFRTRRRAFRFLSPPACFIEAGGLVDTVRIENPDKPTAKCGTCRHPFIYYCRRNAYCVTLPKTLHSKTFHTAVFTLGANLRYKRRRTPRACLKNLKELSPQSCPVGKIWRRECHYCRELCLPK